MILRLHNLCWRHAIQCRRVLTPPKKLTYRKLFGLYFHSCVTHSAQLLRLASHRSTNAEMFERLFEKLSDITTKTCSKRIEDLSTNAILHLQAEKSNPVNNCILKEEREISKMAKSLPKLDNTTLLKSELEKYAGDWVAHLRLCLVGKGKESDPTDASANTPLTRRPTHYRCIHRKTYLS